MFHCESADKTAYESQTLAENAVTIHHLSGGLDNCGFHAYPHTVNGERHWHTGHKKADKGETCKAETDFHRPVRPTPPPPHKRRARTIGGRR